MPDSNKCVEYSIQRLLSAWGKCLLSSKWKESDTLSIHLQMETMLTIFQTAVELSKYLKMLYKLLKIHRLREKC